MRWFLYCGRSGIHEDDSTFVRIHRPLIFSSHYVIKVYFPVEMLHRYPKRARVEKHAGEMSLSNTYGHALVSWAHRRSLGEALLPQDCLLLSCIIQEFHLVLVMGGGNTLCCRRPTATATTFPTYLHVVVLGRDRGGVDVEYCARLLNQHLPGRKYDAAGERSRRQRGVRKSVSHRNGWQPRTKLNCCEHHRNAVII